MSSSANKAVNPKPRKIPGLSRRSQAEPQHMSFHHLRSQYLDRITADPRVYPATRP